VYAVAALGQSPRRIASGWHPDWSPRGRWIVFKAPSGRLALVRYRGDAVARDLTVRGSEPNFSPDGKWVAFVRGRYPRSSIYRIRLRDRVARRVTPPANPPGYELDVSTNSSPDWRPVRRGTRTRCR